MINQRLSLNLSVQVFQALGRCRPITGADECTMRILHEGVETHESKWREEEKLCEIALDWFSQLFSIRTLRLLQICEIRCRKKSGYELVIIFSCRLPFPRRKKKCVKRDQDQWQCRYAQHFGRSVDQSSVFEVLMVKRRWIYIFHFSMLRARVVIPTWVY